MASIYRNISEYVIGNYTEGKNRTYLEVLSDTFMNGFG